MNSDDDENNGNSMVEIATHHNGSKDEKLAYDELLNYKEEFCFPLQNNKQVNIQLITSISREARHTGTHLWNCSVLLTNYLIAQLESGGEELFGKLNNGPITIIELGCGLGLPSIATCKLNPKNRCILTDLSTPDFEKRCSTQCEINDLAQDQYDIIPIDWGNNFMEIAKFARENSGKKIDLIVATDCLYDKKLYDPFFSTVHFLKKLFNNPDLPLLLAQYKRNESDNITYQLKRWNLKPKPVVWKESINLEKYLKIMGKSNDILEKQFYELYDSTQIVVIQ